MKISDGSCLYSYTNRMMEIDAWAKVKTAQRIISLQETKDKKLNTKQNIILKNSITDVLNIIDKIKNKALNINNSLETYKKAYFKVLNKTMIYRVDYELDTLETLCIILDKRVENFLKCCAALTY